MKLSTWLHQRLIHRGRVAVLAQHVADTLPPNASLLDVGCGDGLLAMEIKRLRPDVSIDGLDVMVRPNALIPVKTYDGHRIPFADNSYDVVILVDVVHHASNQEELLQEVTRVASSHVVIKDHLADGLMTRPLLRLMDYVGNRHAGVALPYIYLDRRQWTSLWDSVGLKPGKWTEKLRIYPWFADWLFGRGLHFCARLDHVQPPA